MTRQSDPNAREPLRHSLQHSSRMRAGARWLTLGALALALIAGIAGLASGAYPAPGDLMRVAMYLVVSGLLSLMLLAGATWLRTRERPGGLWRVGMRVGMRPEAPVALAALLVAANMLVLAGMLFVAARDLWLLLAFSVFALAVALALAWRPARRQARALGGIQHGMERLVMGEYPPFTRVEEPDELAHLRELVELMARMLRDAEEGRRVAEAHRRQVIAAVAHDLRTPLAAVQMLVDALADGVVSDPAAIDQHYGTLRREVCHLTTVVEDLFELARIESGALTLAHVPVPLGDLVAGAINGQRARATRGRVRLWWEARSGGALADILGDAEQLYRVLEGMLRNALRHTPAGGSVLVRLSSLAGHGAGERVLVEVMDTGSGIAAEALPHIFEPMYRAEAARTRQHQGAKAVMAPIVAEEVGEDDEDADCEAGLGLAIAARLIAAHGGRMWAESPLPAEARVLVAGPVGIAAGRPDELTEETAAWPGTVVSFTLPVVLAVPPLDAAHQEP